jgi:hypothetical protein
MLGPVTEGGEVLVAFPAHVEPLTEVRTTVLLASQEALRTLGHFDAYVRCLESHQTELASLFAGAWVPVDVAAAHYRACDRLALPHAQIVDLGRMVSRSTHNILAAAVVRMARELGTTPWNALSLADRFWARSWKGSAVSVERIAPKDAHIRVTGTPLAAVPYFRIAFVGFCIDVAEIFGRKGFARHVPDECGPTTLGYHLAWA